MIGRGVDQHCASLPASPQRSNSIEQRRRRFLRGSSGSQAPHSSPSRGTPPDEPQPRIVARSVLMRCLRGRGNGASTRRWNGPSTARCRPSRVSARCSCCGLGKEPVEIGCGLRRRSLRNRACPRSRQCATAVSVNGIGRLIALAAVGRRGEIGRCRSRQGCGPPARRRRSRAAPWTFGESRDARHR
jgi:hypothetical protein